MKIRIGIILVALMCWLPVQADAVIPVMDRPEGRRAFADLAAIYAKGPYATFQAPAELTDLESPDVSKSKTVLAKTQITKAREGLNNNAGLPNAHTIGFVMQRLFEANDDAKATALEDYSEGSPPQKEHVTHMIFTFSGNDPKPLFVADITASTVPFAHMSVGFWCRDHQLVIAESYKKAADGSDE